ncbi:MAG: PaaI family thioesterase [Flavobacteriaceae bacterium]|nr:PaaI family thioesterase [Flavobacteriaceae bacterium]
MDKSKIIDACNALCKNTLMQTLNITYTDCGEDYLTATIPVTAAVHQPDGVLHGGASAALAESVASAATYVFMNSEKVSIRGVELSINHIKSMKEGVLTAKAQLVHRGRTMQLWQIELRNDQHELISLAKLTTLSLSKNR